MRKGQLPETWSRVQRKASFSVEFSKKQGSDEIDTAAALTVSSARGSAAGKKRKGARSVLDDLWEGGAASEAEPAAGPAASKGKQSRKGARTVGSPAAASSAVSPEQPQKSGAACVKNRRELGLDGVGLAERSPAGGQH